MCLAGAFIKIPYSQMLSFGWKLTFWEVEGKINGVCAQWYPVVRWSPGWFLGRWKRACFGSKGRFVKRHKPEFSLLYRVWKDWIVLMVYPIVLCKAYCRFFVAWILSDIEDMITVNSDIFPWLYFQSFC